MRSIPAKIDHALGRLYAACGVIAAIAIAMIAVLVATSIVSRLLGVYIGGLNEGAGYLMAAAGAFGLAYTFTSGAHIRVDLILGALPRRACRIFEFVAMVLTTTATLYLAWFMVRMVRISWEFGDLSDGSDGLPLWLPQLPAAIGFGVFAMALIHNFLRFCLTGEAVWRQSGDNFLTGKDRDRQWTRL